MRSLSRRLSLVLLAFALLAGPSALPASAVSGAPRFQMPFACGEYRRASTSHNHKPGRRAIDLNLGYGNQDIGSIVVASAGGRVHLRKASWKSYGKFIVIDHGHGWQTIYAHLAAFAVRNGVRVQQGDKIGWVGNNKGEVLAHLHFEQRHGGVLQKIRFGGHRIAYRDNPRYVVYKSANNCRAKPKAPAAAAKPAPSQAAAKKATPATDKASNHKARRSSGAKRTHATRTGNIAKAAPTESGPVLPLLPFVGGALVGAWGISRRVYRAARS